MLQKKDREKILFFRESCFKIAGLIFNYPNKKFHIRELAKKTKLSTTAVISSIKDLKNFKIIKLYKTDLTTDVQADLESESYFFYKKIFNLYRLERYSIIQTLKESFRAETIVLFGSFAKGEDIEESDIDILILSKSKLPKEPDLSIPEKELNRKINLHVLKSLDKSAPEFKNSAANGIVLYGYLKVI
ncbi:nucleotidyltransferase domain-containing protein [Candidatus Woesearchaeota archaeon]|nr:nucleotidyltransferase domain-containing protein [Candidatus Woesearchaeota archaeon]